MSTTVLSAEEKTGAPIYGLVLGGGRSRRMGVDKATLIYQGKPQLEIAYDLLAPFCEKRFVGIRPEQAQLPGFRAFPPLFDAFPGEGPLGAVVSAQKQFPEAAWLVVACDLPFLKAETIEKLLLARSVSAQAIAYSSAYDGLVEPMCALYEPASASQLGEAFAEGLRCARKGLQKLNPVTLTLPSPQDLDNANTPEDRVAALQALGQDKANPVVEAG